MRESARTPESTQYSRLRARASNSKENPCPLVARYSKPSIMQQVKVEIKQSKIELNHGMIIIYLVTGGSKFKPITERLQP